MPSTGSSVDATEQRIESVSLKIGEQNLPKLKYHEKKKSENYELKLHKKLTQSVPRILLVI